MVFDICPRSVRLFVWSCRPQLSEAQFRRVWTIILAIAVTPRGSKLIHLAAAVLDGCHRTSLGAFMRRDNWDEQALLDGSGTVDFGDLLIVLDAWGPCE